MPFEIEPRPATATELEAVRARLAVLEAADEDTVFAPQRA